MNGRKFNAGLVVLTFLVCAIFVLPHTAEAAALDEQERIDGLLEALGQLNGVVFIRNGTEHNAVEAVDHLKRKLRMAGDRISTAEEFIDGLATASSFSQKPYLIQRPGQAPEPAGPFFHHLLQELDSQR